MQTESQTQPIGSSLAEVQPVFGETKATKPIAHYDTPPSAGSNITVFPGIGEVFVFLLLYAVKGIDR